MTSTRVLPWCDDPEAEDSERWIRPSPEKSLPPSSPTANDHTVVAAVHTGGPLSCPGSARCRRCSMPGIQDKPTERHWGASVRSGRSLKASSGDVPDRYGEDPVSSPAQFGLRSGPVDTVGECPTSDRERLRRSRRPLFAWS